MQNPPPLHPGVAIAGVCLGAAALLAWLGPSEALAVDGRPVLAQGKSQPSIEDAFAAKGVVHMNGVDYRLSDGIFRSLHGARVWVAVAMRSSKASFDASQPMLIERDGQVFAGTLHAIASQHANLQQSQDRKPEIPI